MLRVINVTKGACLAEKARLASGFWSRAMGLWGRPSLEQGEGLVICPCRAVHTFGMRFPLDVVHLDGAGRVCGLALNLPPYRLGPVLRETRLVIELPAGTIKGTGTGIGDQILVLRDVV